MALLLEHLFGCAGSFDQLALFLDGEAARAVRRLTVEVLDQPGHHEIRDLARSEIGRCVSRLERGKANYRLGLRGQRDKGREGCAKNSEAAYGGGRAEV